MSKRHTLKTLAAAAALALAGIAPQAVAQESLKIGLILPMTGRSRRRAARSTPPSSSTWRATATRWRARRSR